MEGTDLIKDLKFEIAQLKAEMKNEIAQLRNETTQFKNEMKNEIAQLTNKINLLEEKLNIMKEKKEEDTDKILNLDSKIINENHNETIKFWIDPSKTIRAKLLYRLSKHGDKISTFHELCDYRGNTLTLFHVNDGNKVGIYTESSWDKYSEWKNYGSTFIFNLNKNRYYYHEYGHTIYCNSLSGPTIHNFGCYNTNSMRSIRHNGNQEINKYFKGASEILPSGNQEKIYNLLEVEVYKIKFE